MQRRFALRCASHNNKVAAVSMLGGCPPSSLQQRSYVSSTTVRRASGGGGGGGFSMDSFLNDLSSTLGSEVRSGAKTTSKKPVVGKERAMSSPSKSMETAPAASATATKAGAQSIDLSTIIPEDDAAASPSPSLVSIVTAAAAENSAADPTTTSSTTAEKNDEMKNQTKYKNVHDMSRKYLHDNIRKEQDRIESLKLNLWWKKKLQSDAPGATSADKPSTPNTSSTSSASSGEDEMMSRLEALDGFSAVTPQQFSLRKKLLDKVPSYANPFKVMTAKTPFSYVEDGNGVSKGHDSLSHPHAHLSPGVQVFSSFNAVQLSGVVVDVEYGFCEVNSGAPSGKMPASVKLTIATYNYNVNDTNVVGGNKAYFPVFLHGKYWSASKENGGAGRILRGSKVHVIGELGTHPCYDPSSKRTLMNARIDLNIDDANDNRFQIWEVPEKEVVFSNVMTQMKEKAVAAQEKKAEKTENVRSQLKGVFRKVKREQEDVKPERAVVGARQSVEV